MPSREVQRDVCANTAGATRDEVRALITNGSDEPVIVRCDATHGAHQPFNVVARSPVENLDVFVTSEQLTHRERDERGLIRSRSELDDGSFD